LVCDAASYHRAPLGSRERDAKRSTARAFTSARATAKVFSRGTECGAPKQCAKINGQSRDDATTGRRARADVRKLDVESDERGIGYGLK